MSLLNPYDDYTPSEGSPVERALEFLFDIGAGVWLFLLSPLGLGVGILAWITWGGLFLSICVLVGGVAFALSGLFAAFSIVRFFLFERGREEPSKGTVRMFGIAGILIVISSVAGLLMIAYCLLQLI